MSAELSFSDLRENPLIKKYASLADSPVLGGNSKVAYLVRVCKIICDDRGEAL